MDELSYLAGLIAEDGHLENKTNRIVIFSNDKEFVDSLDKILKIVISKKSVFYDSNATEWKISFYSKTLQDLLIRDYGLLKGSKSRTVEFPENAKDVKSYISGLFDAEGWFEKDKGIYLRIRLKMNSERLVKSISDNLKSFSIESRFHKRKGGTFVKGLQCKPCTGNQCFL